jgi:hypothetical protein
MHRNRGKGCTDFEAVLGAFIVVACPYRTRPYNRDLGTEFEAVFVVVLTVQGCTSRTVRWHVFQGCLALKSKWIVGTFF